MDGDRDLESEGESSTRTTGNRNERENERNARNGEERQKKIEEERCLEGKERRMVTGHPERERKISQGGERTKVVVRNDNTSTNVSIIHSYVLRMILQNYIL